MSIQEKKRGRPPKNSNLNKDPIITTIKNTENEFKKYSLINNNIINTNSNITKNIIVHLKISKDKLAELEQIISNNMAHTLYNNFDLLDNIKFTIFEKLPESNNNNEIKNEIKNKDKNEIEATDNSIKSNNSDKSIKSNNSIKSDIINKKTTLALNKNLNEEKNKIRRNLIINAGIKYKINKIMLNFNYNESQDIWCWNCCHPFNNTPVGIPEKISYNDNKFIFELSGVFCSYNCAYRNLRPTMIDDSSNINTNCDLYYSDDKADKIQMLEMLCHIEMQTPLNTKIKPAPSRSVLKVFGGKISIEEYRANFLQNSVYHVYKYPMISINYNLEETSQTNNSVINKINIAEIDESYEYYCKLLKLTT